MSEAVIGALRAELGIDTAQFSKGIAVARGELAVFANTAKMVGGALVAAMGVGLIKVADGVRDVIDQADKLNKTSQKIGIPVEQLSKLAYAAELSDINVEQLTSAVGKFNKYLVSTGQGSRQVDEALLSVAEKFSTMPDGAEKTALAMQLFGKAGADMIPLLNGGADGLRKMYSEAREFGVVISGETAAKAEEFNDNLTRLGAIWGGLMVRLAAGLVGPLKDLSDWLVTLPEKLSRIGPLLDALGKIGTSFNPITIAQGFGELGKALDHVNSGMPTLSFEQMHEDLVSKGVPAWLAYKKVVGESRTELERIKPTTEAIGFMQQRVAGATGDQWLQMAGQGAEAFGSLFDDQKEFAEAGAVINAAQAITKSFAEYGFTPAGIAAAALAALACGAQIAKIESTQPGNSSKPSVSAGGGGGGVMRGNNNSSAGGQLGNGGAGVNITLVGESGFTGAQVRAMMAGISQAVGDGVSIRVN